MARHTGPKHKQSRREGVDLIGKGVKLHRLNVPPGMHGPKMRGKKMSNFGIQLREKQKLKRIYGLLEKQFAKYVEVALNNRGDTAAKLMQLLETRLDNVVYRAGLAPTRAMARQIIVHGHINVDGQRVDRPSCVINADQTVALSEKIAKNPDIQKLLQEELQIPSWIERKSGVAHVKRAPLIEDIQEAVNTTMVIEYYSR